MENRGGALGQRFQAAVETTAEVRRVSDQGGRPETLEEVEHRRDTGAGSGAGFDDRRDGIDGDALGRPLTDEPRQLVERYRWVGCPREFPREIQLVPHDHQTLVSQRGRQVQSEVITLGEQVGRVVVGQERGDTPVVESGVQELEARDALARSGRTGQDVRSPGHNSAEPLVQRTDSAFHQRRHRMRSGTGACPEIRDVAECRAVDAVRSGSHTYAPSVPPQISDPDAICCSPRRRAAAGPRTKDVIAPDGRVFLTDVPERNRCNAMAFDDTKETLQQGCVGHPDLPARGGPPAQYTCRAVALEPETFTPLTAGCFREAHRDALPGRGPPVSI